MNGNKTEVRAGVAFVLIWCLLLSGCSNKTTVNENSGDSKATVDSTSVEPTGSSETTSSIADGEETETQNNTKAQENAMPDDEFAAEDSVQSAEPSDRSTDSTTTTILENEENDVPDCGIELPDDNWD